MSKNEKIKASLDILKVALIALLTAIFGICGYAVIHYKTIDIFQSLSMGVGFIVLLVSISLILRKINKNLNELENL